MTGSVQIVCLTTLLVAGCGSKTLQGPTDGGGDRPVVAAEDAGNDLPAEAYTGCLETSSLSMGIQLDFVQWPCRFTQRQAQAGVRFPYRLVVHAPLAGVHPSAGDAGGCAQPDESGLIVTYRISGGGQNYCLCDTGLCVQNLFTTNPVAGTYDRSFTWTGENWTGPSDYGAPKGPPFPPGSYTVSVSAAGMIEGGGDAALPFSASAQTTITITP